MCTTQHKCFRVCAVGLINDHRQARIIDSRRQRTQRYGGTCDIGSYLDLAVRWIKNEFGVNLGSDKNKGQRKKAARNNVGNIVAFNNNRFEPALGSWGIARWVFGDTIEELFAPDFEQDQIPALLEKLEETLNQTHANNP